LVVKDGVWYDGPWDVKKAKTMLTTVVEKKKGNENQA